MMALKGMNAQQKAKFEQQAVMALAGVFVLVFLMGPAKMLFGGGARPAAKATAPAVVTLPHLLQQRNQLLDDSAKAASAGPVKKPASLAVGYTAGELRDPMSSLLPVAAKRDPRQALQAAQQTMKQPAAPPKPPPKLEVQGLLWGGGAPKALIGGKLYGVGEMVEGVTILSIDRARVTVAHESGTMSYEVSKPTPPMRGRPMGR